MSLIRRIPYFRGGLSFRLKAVKEDSFSGPGTRRTSIINEIEAQNDKPSCEVEEELKPSSSPPEPSKLEQSYS